jgi:hypothetical protein
MWAIWSLFGGKVEETKGEEKESKENVEGDDAEEDPGEVGDVVGELPIWTKRVVKTVEVTRSSKGSDDGSDTGSMHSGTSTVTTTTSVEEIVLAGDCDRPLPSLLRTPAPLTGEPLGNASSLLHTTSPQAATFWNVTWDARVTPLPNMTIPSFELQTNLDEVLT